MLSNTFELKLYIFFIFIFLNVDYGMLRSIIYGKISRVLSNIFR